METTIATSFTASMAENVDPLTIISIFPTVMPVPLIFLDTQE